MKKNLGFINSVTSFNQATVASFIKKPILISGPTIWACRDVKIRQGRRLWIIPKAAPSLFASPTVNPFMPIPPEHDVVRVGKRKEWILLENDGILSVGVRFNISDRKKLGLNNKTRQLTLFYKVVSTNFKAVLNDYLNNNESTPIGPPYFAGVKGVVHTLYGTYNGVPLQVPISVEDFQGNMNLGLNGIDNQSNYLKVITYKFHQAWVNTILQPGFNLPTPRIILGGNVNTPTPVQSSSDNIIASSGLFLFRDERQLFDLTPISSQTPVTRDIPEERDLEGRVEPPSNTLGQTVLPEQAQNVGNNFAFFARLPISFTILERNQFNVPSAPEGTQNPTILEAINQAFSRVTGTVSTGAPITSALNFDLSPVLYTAASSNLAPEEKCERHELVITERKVEFFLDQYDAITQISDAPFVFTFFEGNARYERCYVDASYLGAALHATLLQYVRRTHSMRVVYNSLSFDSYQKKNWYNEEESFCKKIPLRNISSKQVLFNALVSGTNPTDTVNTTANLMFSGDFKNKQGVFYRPNRFITSSAFSNQTQIQEPGMRQLWTQLENGFSFPVVLCTYPLVGLIPCFPRGEIIQVTESIVFRGLVSNSGGDEMF